MPVMAATQATVTGVVMDTAVMVTAVATLILLMDQVASITVALPSGSGFTVVDPVMVTDAAATTVVIVADIAADTVDMADIMAVTTGIMGTIDPR